MEQVSLSNHPTPVLSLPFDAVPVCELSQSTISRILSAGKYSQLNTMSVVVQPTGKHDPQRAAPGLCPLWSAPTNMLRNVLVDAEIGSASYQKSFGFFISRLIGTILSRRAFRDSSIISKFFAGKGTLVPSPAFCLGKNISREFQLNN